MTLKPFRDYSEHEVVNLYALNEGSGDKGTFVQMLRFDPDNYDSWADKFPGVPSYAYSADHVFLARVQIAPTNTQTGILGMLLYDVRETLPYLNTPTQFASPYRIAEQQVVASGQVVPILTRGIVEIGGFDGTPMPGAGAYISSTNKGALKVDLPHLIGQVGTWLSSSGADGCALLKVHAL